MTAPGPSDRDSLLTGDPQVGAACRRFEEGWRAARAGGERPRVEDHLGDVLTGEPGQADDGVLVDADEPCGLADAAALGEVLEHGQELVAGQAAVEQGGALALGEAGLTGLAIQEAALLLSAVAAAGGEVAVVTAVVVGAIGVQAAGAAEVVQSSHNTSAGAGMAKVLALL